VLLNFHLVRPSSGLVSYFVDGSVEPSVYVVWWVGLAGFKWIYSKVLAFVVSSGERNEVW
jgi:hypothetical protein